MGVLYRASSAGLGVLLTLLTLACAGCHMTEPGMAVELLRYQASVDPSGLKPSEPIAVLKANCAAPENWRELNLQKNLLFTHQHWKSPTGATGIGVVYVRMPLPLAAKTVASFAKNEYAKQDKGNVSTLLAEGFDQFGRYWFEGENAKYHVRGYVITHGFDAWVIYSGYKMTMPLNPDEQVLAAKCIETVLPNGVENAAEMARTKPEYPKATASAN